MRSAVTLCRVPEAAAGPFVFHEPLEQGFAIARETGFDGVELFLPGPEAFPIREIQSLSQLHGLGIAAVGTGAGMVKHGLSLTEPSPEKRAAALDFVRAMITFGGQLGAPVILGSMQGKSGDSNSRDQALEWLADALRIAGREAAAYGVPFLYEPLNRYETNLINRLGDAISFIQSHALENIALLADLFHMNIEETDIAAALRDAAGHIGHVHYADSNRRAMGFGHTDPKPVIAALTDIGFAGHLSAEIFPIPDALTAARQTIQSIHSVL